MPLNCGCHSFDILSTEKQVDQINSIAFRTNRCFDEKRYSLDHSFQYIFRYKKISSRRFKHNQQTAKHWHALEGMTLRVLLICFNLNSKLYFNNNLWTMLDNYVLTSFQFHVFKGDIAADWIEAVFHFRFLSPLWIKMCLHAERWKSRGSGIMSEKMDYRLGGKGSSFFYYLPCNNKNIKKM